VGCEGGKARGKREEREGELINDQIKMKAGECRRAGLEGRRGSHQTTCTSLRNTVTYITSLARGDGLC